MSRSLDNFEDAVEALRRDGVSFIICQRRHWDESGENLLYRVEGELHDTPCDDEFMAMAEAVKGYCEDAT